jgi:hypothetical protein
MVSRNPHCLLGAEKLEHIFPRPVKVTVSNAGCFKSAEHLLGMVFRFFGKKIQCLVLNLTLSEGMDVELAYPLSPQRFDPFDLWCNLDAAPLSMYVFVPPTGSLPQISVLIYAIENAL